MEKTKLTYEDALTFYPHLDETGKQIFKERYKEFFKHELNYEAACKKSGLNSEEQIPSPSPKTNRHKKLNAFAQLDVIREAHGNHPGIDEAKWYPVFKTTPAGLVFSYTNYEYWCSLSNAVVCSPFVFKTSDEASDFGNNNLDLYNAAFAR